MCERKTDFAIRRLRDIAIACVSLFCMAPSCGEDDDVRIVEKDSEKSTPRPAVDRVEEKSRAVPPAEAGPVMSELELRVRKSLRGSPTRKNSRALGRDAVPVLLSIIRNEDDVQYWRNSVSMLGHLGDERALIPLMELLENQSGELSKTKCGQFRQIPWAIGHIAEAGSEEAFDYLTRGLREEDWKRLEWTCRGVDSEELRRFYAERAIMGLAVSGRKEAPAILRDLERETGRRPDSMFKRRRLDLIREALRVHREIEKVGMDQFFDHPIK